jgi:DNA repair protein SbcD/Mre11
MFKIVFGTDLHLRATKPLSRLDDDFLETLLDKMDQVREYSKDADLVILGGDIFDRPDVPHSVVLKTIRTLSKFQVPLYTIVGNHDIFGYQGTTVDSTALGVLFESGCIKKLDVLGPKEGIDIYGLHAYDKTTWEVPPSSGVKILVAHKMLTNKSIPNANCIMIKDVAMSTNADIILSGDIHYPHIEEINGKIFINPGSLARLSITDRYRYPQVSIITIEDSGEINHSTEPLNSRPAETLFDINAYSNRMASEAHTNQFVKTYVQMVVSVKAEAHRMEQSLEDLMEANNVPRNVRESVKKFYGRAEREILHEIKD